MVDPRKTKSESFPFSRAVQTLHYTVRDLLIIGTVMIVLSLPFLSMLSITLGLTI